MKILETEVLPDVEYFKNSFKKKLIVLHHTVSSTAKSTIDYFKEDKGKSRVAVAYCIDKDGTIYQLFDPKYWGFHIGLGSTIYDNQSSIGIEITNEGPLYKRDNGDYYWWVEKGFPQGKIKYEGTPFEIKEEWRDFKYFASYTDEQIQSTIELVNYLIGVFNIRKRQILNFDYNKDLLKYYTGVLSHCNVRADKTDLSPAFPLGKIFENLLVNIEPKPVEFIPYTSSLSTSNYIMEAINITENVDDKLISSNNTPIEEVVPLFDNLIPENRKRKSKFYPKMK